MFKLPRLQDSRGFTLIELLVAIAIIAIISVIAIALFTGVQADARDGKRKAELESISKALEINKDNQNSAYVAVDNTKFGGNKYPGNRVDYAVDPQGFYYCISTNQTAGTFPSDPTPTEMDGWTVSPGLSCPSGYRQLDNAAFAANTVAWKICTRTEKKDANGKNIPYCRTNVQ